MNAKALTIDVRLVVKLIFNGTIMSGNGTGNLKFRDHLVIKLNFEVGYVRQPMKIEPFHSCSAALLESTCNMGVVGITI